MFTEYKFSAAEIDARSAEVAGTLANTQPGREAAQFAADTVAARLQRSPRHYLEFGPYWWAVKAALARLGHDLGRQDDAIVRAEYGGTLSDLGALVAGEMFKDHYRAHWFAGNAQFWLDGEAGESYVLFDLDMHQRALGMEAPGTEGPEISV